MVANAQDANDHWNSSARLVLRGSLPGSQLTPEGRRDLIEVRRLLHLPPDEFDALLEDMPKQHERARGVPAEMAGALSGMGPDEMGSVLSTVRQNLPVLSSKAWKHVFPTRAAALI